MTIWNLIARTAARPAVANWLIRRAIKTPYLHLPSNDNPSYMERFWVFNPYDRVTNKPRWRFCPWSIRIHHIKREDYDRDLHDHPWNARTIILKGWYTEKRLISLTDPAAAICLADLAQFTPVDKAIATEHFCRNPGDTAKLGFGEYHSITDVADGGVWTLFISGPWRGVWGFLVDGHKVPWKTYLGIPEKGDISNETPAGAQPPSEGAPQFHTGGYVSNRLSPDQEHLLDLWQRRLDTPASTLTPDEERSLAWARQRVQRIDAEEARELRKGDPVAKEFANVYVQVVNERGSVIEHHNVVPIGKMGIPDTLLPSRLPMWDECRGQARDTEEDANHQLAAYAGAIASLTPAVQQPRHPLTNIATWQHGCSCAPTNNPVECSECTLGLIASIEAWFKWQQGRAAK